VDLVFDLDRELSRRREHQHPAARRGGRAVDVGPRRREQPLQSGHDERGGFAGAGFGARDDVAAGEGEGNHSGLHRASVLEPEIADAFEEPRVQIQRGERHGRRVARRRFERRRRRCCRPLGLGVWFRTASRPPA
jgi:hypothetical protein